MKNTKSVTTKNAQIAIVKEEAGVIKRTNGNSGVEPYNS